MYIGKSKSIYDRLKKHRIQLDNNKHTNSGLQSDYNISKYDFFFEAIRECEEAELYDKEQLYINEYNSIKNG